MVVSPYYHSYSRIRALSFGLFLLGGFGLFLLGGFDLGFFCSFIIRIDGKDKFVNEGSSSPTISLVANNKENGGGAVCEKECTLTRCRRRRRRHHPPQHHYPNLPKKGGRVIDPPPGVSHLFSSQNDDQMRSKGTGGVNTTSRVGNQDQVGQED